MVRFISVVAMLVIFAACNNSGSETPAAPVTPLTQQQKINIDIDSFKAQCSEGDLVAHLNDDIVSSVVMNMNENDKSFSHSGIIVIRNGQKTVCNILPPDGTNSLGDTIRFEPLDSFINPRYNLTAGLFRYDLNETEKMAFLAELNKYKAKNPHFDEIYDYKTDDKIYCSELIAKSIEKATANRISFKKIRLTETMVKLFQIYYKKHKLTDDFVRNMPYVSIDNLYNIPQCKEVMRIKLKQITL